MSSLEPKQRLRLAIGGILLKCGESSLSEADAAVIGRDRVVCPYLKMFLLKERF